MPLSPTASDPRGADERPALILANLGTPSAPTARAVRPFLREFLSDRRIVETHPLLWRPVLEGIILRVRPRASAAKYATIWRPGEETSRSGSPLMHYSERQGELLQDELGESVQVRIAMRYGQPALRRVMGELMGAGCRRIALIPLYPQYAASSAGTVVDEAARFILASRNQPELRTIRSFETAPAYIEALATALEQHWQVHGRPDPAAGERLLLSFHSIPQAMHDAGDPYRAECERTVELLSRRLDLPEGLAQLTFSPSSDPLPGSGRPPSTRSASSAAPVAPALTSSAPVSSPTAWRLSRRSTSSTARPSPLPEAAASTTSPGATTPTEPLPPWLSRPERYWPAGSEPGAARRPRYRIRPENRSQHERPQPLTGETDARDGMVTRTVPIL